MIPLCTSSELQGQQRFARENNKTEHVEP